MSLENEITLLYQDMKKFKEDIIESIKGLKLDMYISELEQREMAREEREKGREERERLREEREKKREERENLRHEREKERERREMERIRSESREGRMSSQFSEQSTELYRSKRAINDMDNAEQFSETRTRVASESSNIITYPNKEINDRFERERTNDVDNENTLRYMGPHITVRTGYW